MKMLSSVKKKKRERREEKRREGMYVYICVCVQKRYSNMYFFFQI